jgi:cytochrome b6-f complex iron-sulfur subunit
MAGMTGQEKTGTPRRRFLGWLWGLLGIGALAEGAWISGSFLRPRPGRNPDADLILAGPADDFAPGSVTAFPAGRFYLVRLDDGGFLALHRECTHLGCTIPWSSEQQRFVCPCHASSFDIRGSVLSPPAPRPLDLLAVRIENGIVKVDPSSRSRRGRFEPSQAVRG